jgi:hypothetical protein
MENLNVFVEIILVALAGASLTNFFDDCIQDGMIFGRYGNWLRKEENFWKKPIGGCMICTNVYVTIFMLIMYKFILILFMIFAIIGVSNTLLKKIIS